MKKLSLQEIEKVEFKTYGLNGIDTTKSPFYQAVNELEVGEGLHVTQQEFARKTKVSNASLPKWITGTGKKFVVRTLKDGSSFVIIRKA